MWQDLVSLMLLETVLALVFCWMTYSVNASPNFFTILFDLD